MTRDRITRRDFLREGGHALIGASLVPLIACSRDSHQNGHSPESSRKALIADLEKQIPELMRQAAVPGLSIVIIEDARVSWRRAFGFKNAESKAPVDDDTVFEAASMSKPVFAYVVMKLCERGVMTLDTPLTTYTSERFVQNDPRLDLITARDILSHTSGLPNWRSTDEPLAIHFTPGTKWSYSGEGYSYLQSVVTHLIGGRVDRSDCSQFEAHIEVCATIPNINDYMQANLLVPFGMTSSGFLWTEAMEAHMAKGYDPSGKPLAKSRKPTGPSLARYGVAGGLSTTPTDYARFLINILDPKPSDNFRLTTASVQEMLRPQVKRNTESSWALGWEIDHTEDGDFIRHGGGNPGFSCFVAGSVARKSGYVIMTNSEDNGYVGVIAKLIAGDTLSQFIGGRPRAASE